MKGKKLYKLDSNQAKIFGVCGGVAEYFDIDPVIVRVVWAVLALVYGTGLFAYVIAAFVMPKKSEVVKEEPKKNTKQKVKKEEKSEETSEDN